YAEALTWYSQGLDSINEIEDEADRVGHRMRFMLGNAGVCIRQGHFQEAIWSADMAINDARALDDEAGLGHAYYLMHLAHTSSGSKENVRYRDLALPIFERQGDLVRLGNTLNNIGIEAYYAGRWEEAMDFYGRGHEARERTGDVAGAAFALNNMAEIMSDRGQLKEAEAIFRRCRDIGTATGNRLLRNVAVGNLGRAAARDDRFDDSEELLVDAIEEFRTLGADSFVLETEARLAELHVLRGNTTPALRLCDEVLGRVGGTGTTVVLEAMLRRLRGYALAQAGDLETAFEEIRGSVEAGRKAEADYEVALSLRALAEITDLDCEGGGATSSAESREILERLGVKAVPAVPLATARPVV
ncbi:MAG: tetratricopeptide repeat protein, partial [Candidatus Dormibacteria bacterium]